MKTLLRTILLLLFCFTLSTELSAQEIIKGEFEHVVLFYLKNPDSQADKDRLERGLRDLIQSSEYIVSAHLGVPAMTDRAVVDNSYTFNYTVTFESKEAQDSYQTEPVHLQFIDDYKDLWDKVVIFDSVNLLEDQ